MALTNEYQYIGRSNAVKDQNSRYSYYILLYAKTSGDMTTGRHTVSVKMLLASEMNTFYGYATSGSITINGSSVSSWSWKADAPGTAWNHSNLTAGGVTYKHAVDIREVSHVVNVGYGVTKDIPIAASWVFNSGNQGYMPQVSVTASVSVSVTLPMIAGASTPTVRVASVPMGEALVIATNRASAAFTHTLTYRFGSASGTIGETVGDSVSWAPSLELARQIPNGTSGTAVISCVTYLNGKAIGTKEVTVVLTVPASVVPTASATWEDTSGAFSKMGAPVQNISKLRWDVTGTGSYGSTIVSAAVTLKGKAYSGGILTDAGAIPVKITVTDSRGRVGIAEDTLTVAAYAPPSLTLSASRCLEDGTADEAGDHAKVTVSGFVTQVNGQNAAELQVSWGGGAETVLPEVGQITWEKIVPADPDTTAQISATLSDKLASTAKSMVLSTGYATLDLLAGGKGIAFGKAATKEGFECAMTASFPGGIACTKLTAADDLNNIRQNGLYYWDWGDAPANAPSASYGEAYYMNTLRVWSANGNICCQEAIDVSDSSTRGTKLVRTLYGGRAYPWEWENPPMTLGNEYRTTERHNKKAVYTKLINLGTLPGRNGNIHVATGVSATAIVRATGQISDGSTMPYGYNRELISFGVSTATINVYTADNEYAVYSDKTGTAQIWYTKD